MSPLTKYQGKSLPPGLRPVFLNKCKPGKGVSSTPGSMQPTDPLSLDDVEQPTDAQIEVRNQRLLRKGKLIIRAKRLQIIA